MQTHICQAQTTKMTTSYGKKLSVNYYVVINFYHIYYFVGTKKQKVPSISIALIGYTKTVI